MSRVTVLLGTIVTFVHALLRIACLCAEEAARCVRRKAHTQ